MNVNEWSGDIENILDKVRQNSANMSDYHRRYYFKLHNSLNYFKIPIIVISAVNSVLAVMLNKFVDQSYVSVTTSVLALITGIIGSVELFLKINDRMDIEMTSSKHYYLLQVDIFRMLNLDRKNRNGNALDYLNEKIEDYMKLFTASNIKQKYIRDYLIEIDPPFSKIKTDDVDSIDIEIVPARPATIDQLD